MNYIQSRVPRGERKEHIIKLYAAGVSRSEIARTLRVTKSLVNHYIWQYNKT